MKIVITSVQLAFEIPDGADADSFAADATNELLREHQQAFVPASEFMDYAIDGFKTVDVNINATGYVEGQAFSDEVVVVGAGVTNLEPATAGETTHPLLNAAQVACVNSYADGSFAHLLEVKEQAAFVDMVKDCGDTLFVFLMTELATSEDCDSVETASIRVANAIQDLQSVDAALDSLDPVLKWA